MAGLFITSQGVLLQKRKPKGYESVSAVGLKAHGPDLT
jgi:hypothetical protein